MYRKTLISFKQNKNGYEILFANKTISNINEHTTVEIIYNNIFTLRPQIDHIFLTFTNWININKCYHHLLNCILKHTSLTTENVQDLFCYFTTIITNTHSAPHSLAKLVYDYFTKLGRLFLKALCANIYQLMKTQFPNIQTKWIILSFCLHVTIILNTTLY